VVTTFALLDHTDMAEKQDSLTIVRMVGEIIHKVRFGPFELGEGGDYSQSVRLDEAIYLATTDDLQEVLAVDPTIDTSYENHNILWRRNSLYSSRAQVTAGSVFFDEARYETRADEHLDIRVMRKLKEGDNLLYSYCGVWDTFGPVGGTTPITLDPTIESRFAMRGYVKF
jgi:hypothetical protein